MGSPDPRVVRQLRHDVDDVYKLLNTTNKTVATIVKTQREHGMQLGKLQQTVDLQSGRLDRLESAVEQQGERLGRVESAVEQQGQRLGRVETVLGEQGQELSAQGKRLDRIEGTLGQILDLLRRPERSGQA